MFGGISLLDKVLFAKHLSIMIKAGLTLKDGLMAVEEEVKSKRFKIILRDLTRSLEKGESLNSSLNRYPNIFDSFFINTIRIGEASGSLEENLKHLAGHLEKTYDLKRKIKAAMIYPIIILTFTIGLASGLSIFILPKLIPLFRSFNIQLPLPTKILMGIVSAFYQFGGYIVLGIILLIIISILLLRLKPIKKITHTLVIKLPIFGRIVKNTNLAYFSRTLGTLLKSGISVVDALEVTSVTLGNLVYRKVLSGIVKEVRQGELISSYLKTFPEIFPPIVFQMISIGEKTGSLESSLLYLAEFFEKEVDDTTKNLSNILEPILLVLIGLVVGFVVISIIMPIYQVTSGLGR